MKRCCGMCNGVDDICGPDQYIGIDMKRFTAFRLDIDKFGTHNDDQKNPESDPQFEGIIFTDGTVAIRWLTPQASTSVWPDLQTMLAVHGHPEYGTHIEWHDHRYVPDEWKHQLEIAETT